MYLKYFMRDWNFYRNFIFEENENIQENDLSNLALPLFYKLETAKTLTVDEFNASIINHLLFSNVFIIHLISIAF